MNSATLRSRKVKRCVLILLFFLLGVPLLSFGYSKFSHVFILPFAALVTPARRGAVLNPMNFENENAETFGLGKLSELTMKNNLDLLSCVECGRCTQVCPANLAGKSLDPKLIITKTRDLAFQTAAKGENEAAGA
jgi:hypothetical protein